MKILAWLSLLLLSSHVLIYFISNETDVITSLVAAIEMVIIMIILYSQTEVIIECDERSKINKKNTNNTIAIRKENAGK
ncbi:TPA: hypothetical protein JDD69_002517 [Salmonella enterica]|nr:hypothetical protein [Salmonella enterica subsp. enterica]HAU3141524.1 hypothetical protein [Salmonella enterica]